MSGRLEGARESDSSKAGSRSAPVARLQRRQRMAAEEVAAEVAIEDHLDVFVAGLPRILEEPPRLTGVEIGELVADLVERAAQGTPPGLAPTVLRTHLAPAIA